MSSVHPDLSIVIPAYNEEARLPATLERLAEYLPTLGLQTEVLIVDDGSRDRTAAVAGSFAGRISGLRVLSNGTNRGKGYSVRHGMLEAAGELVLFTDADLSAPIEESDKLISALKNGYDVAIGSRALASRLPGYAVQASFYRTILSDLFNSVLQRSGLRGITDTQCGFKLFRQAVAADLFGVS
jgi:Glycosyltransferases involved in cell wall biogenesis